MTMETYIKIEREITRMIRVLTQNGHQPTSIGMPTHAWKQLTDVMAKLEKTDYKSEGNKRTWLGLEVFDHTELEVFGV